MNNEAYRTQKKSYNSFWENKNYNEDFSHTPFILLAKNFLKEIFPDHTTYLHYIEKKEKGNRLNLNYKMEIYKKATSESIKRNISLHLPAITGRGTFIIDGVERVFILQLVLSPGIFFKDRTISIRPKEGYWIDILFEENKAETVKLKKKYKIPLALFLKYTGFTEEDLRETGISPIIPDKKTKKIMAEMLQEKDEEKWPELFKEFLENIDMGRTGKWQMERKTGINKKDNNLTKEAIKEALKKYKENYRDDMDCLSNHMVLQTGDHLEKKIKSIFHGLKRTIEKDMAKKRPEEIMDFIAGKMAGKIEDGVIDLFKTSTLSQLIPSTNILSDVSYLRHITKLGPGGMSKQTAEDYKTRDLHWSHYGRLCPVNTPQSENIGLVLSLTENTKINGYGILEAPYYKVEKSKVKRNKIIWLTPHEEKNHYIAFGDQKIPSSGKKILARKGPLELEEVESHEAEYIDCCPHQAYSLVLLLIPFLSHNDPSRVLISCALLRQALPLKKREIPLVYTGFEKYMAEESCQLLYPSPLSAGPLKVLKGTEETTENPPSVCQGEFAPGVNLLVAYLPWKGYNFEDAIVISDELVKENLLTSLHAVDIEFTVKTDMKITVENTGLWEKDRKNLTPQGIIKKNISVKKGDVLISAVENEEDVSLRTKEEGRVVNIRKSRNKYIITLAIEKPVKVGDKLAGRYGGKGVVSLILEQEKMPYFLNEKGKKKHIQVILNPLGVISRMNPGQILETHLGLIAKKDKVRYKITPFGSIYLNKEGIETEVEPDKNTPENYRIMAQLKNIFNTCGEDFCKNGKVKLHDPECGEIEKPVTAGYQYIMKLNQLAEDKFHFRGKGESYAGITEQPVKGKKFAGGQKVGEMEGWAFLAYEAFENIKEIYGLKSDDLKERKENERGVPEALKIFLYYLRAMCFNLRFIDEADRDITEEILYDEITADKIKNINLSLADEKTIKEWCGNREIKVSTMTENNIDKLAETKGTIYCKDFFGEWRKDPRGDNSSLKEELFKESLKKSNIKEKNIKKGIISSEEREKLLKYLKRFFHTNSIRTFDNCPDRDFSKAFNCLTIDSKKIRRHRMAYINLPEETLHPLFSYKENIKIKLLPLLPIAYRPILQDKNSVKGDLNYHYENIYQNIDRKYGKEELYKSLHRLFRNKKENVSLSKEKKLFINPALTGSVAKNSFITLLEGKEGHIRKYMLGKRTDFSGRGVIVVDPKLTLDEVKIASRKVLKTVLELNGDYREADIENKELLNILTEHPVILNRQPSLHRLSIQAFRNVPGKEDSEDVIYMNPLVTGGFGADFDGDTMAFHIPLSNKAKEEAKKMFPSENILSPANEKLHFNLSQDIKLGIYFGRNDERLINELAPGKKEISSRDLEGFIINIHKKEGTKKDLLEKLAFIIKLILEKATLSGTTFSIFDLPAEKRRMKQYYKGLIEEKDLTENNMTLVSIYSKARGKKDNLLQMCYMKGKVSGIRKRPKEELKEIKSCYLEGLRAGEYYYANYGSRYALVSKKLGTGKAGDLTRHLIEAVYDITIEEEDCKTSEGIKFYFTENQEENLALSGRYLTGRENEEPLNKEKIESLMKESKFIEIRSPVTCKLEKGICARCYGDFLGKPPAGGFPAGIIAAQSTGERGTQLQMKIIHLGGKEDVKGGIGQDLEGAMKLFNGSTEEIKDLSGKKDSSLDIYDLLKLAREVYPTGAIMERHFEVIFRVMLKDCNKGERKSLKEIIKESDFLKSSTFSSTLKLLAKTALDKNNSTVNEGMKKKLLLMAFS